MLLREAEETAPARNKLCWDNTLAGIPNTIFARVPRPHRRSCRDRTCCTIFSPGPAVVFLLVRHASYCWISAVCYVCRSISRRFRANSWIFHPDVSPRERDDIITATDLHRVQDSLTYRLSIDEIIHTFRYCGVRNVVVYIHAYI